MTKVVITQTIAGGCIGIASAGVGISVPAWVVAAVAILAFIGLTWVVLTIVDGVVKHFTASPNQPSPTNA